MGNRFDEPLFRECLGNFPGTVGPGSRDFTPAVSGPPERVYEVFGQSSTTAAAPVDVKLLCARISELALGVQFFLDWKGCRRDDISGVRAGAEVRSLQGLNILSPELHLIRKEAMFCWRTGAQQVALV